MDTELVQGAAGDIHPFDWWFGNLKSKHMHTHEDTAAFGNAIATEAMKAIASAPTTRDITLAAASTFTSLPRRN